MPTAHQERALDIVRQSAIERREKVWQMRVIERKTYREIGAALGISHKTAWKDAKWIAQKRVAELTTKDKAIIAQQNEIYESLLDKWLPVALDKTAEDETAMYATDRVARILVDQAKLHGFHMIQKDAASSQAIGREIGMHVMEAMTRLAQGHNNQVIEAEIITPELEDANNTRHQSAPQGSQS